MIHAIKRPSLNKLFTYFTHDLLNDDSKEEKSSSQEAVASSSSSSAADEQQLKREQMSSKQVWMLTQLSAMVRNRSLYDNNDKGDDDELIEKIVSYFLSNAYFEIDAAKFSSDKVLNSFRDRLFELIGVLFSMPSTRSRLEHVAKSVEAFEKLFKKSSKQIKLREK